MKIVLALVLTLGIVHLNAQGTRGIKVITKDKNGIPQEIGFYQKTYAVIIGIDRYTSLNYNYQLQNAVRDAQGIKQVLSSKFVFDKFYELYNEEATKENILKTLQGDLSKAESEDAIFVFFAGHGFTQTGIGGEDVGFIIPHDGSLEDDAMYKNISMVELRDNISKTLKAKHIFYVMDACYSGTLLAKRAGSKEITADYAYLKSITASPVRQVLTAGGKKEQVLDGGPNGHSVFTGRIIEKLEKVENYITASDLGLYIPKKVTLDASDRKHEQHPQFGNLLGEGDFVFIVKSAQNVNSEDMLAQELAILQEQNKKLEEQRDQEAQQENLKKQEELRTQIANLEKKKKLEMLENEKRDQEKLKAIEEQKRKQELIARIEEEKKKQVTIGESMTYLQAIERISELRSKIEKMETDFDELKIRAILLAVDESPRGEFETKQEYDQRIIFNNQKRRAVTDEYETLKKSSIKVFSDEVTAITSEKFNVGKGVLSLKLGTYNVDGGYFPFTVIVALKTNDDLPMVNVPLQDDIPKLDVHIDDIPTVAAAGFLDDIPTIDIDLSSDAVTEAQELDLCDKYTVKSRVFVHRGDAKKLRENESLLEVMATMIVNADQKLKIDKIIIADVVNNKKYEIKSNISVSTETSSTTAIEILSGDCNRMIFIKGGTFTMGSAFGGYDEKPEHDVIVSDFYMSRYEVTQKLWKSVMRDKPSRFSGCDDCPVERISWNDIQEFIKKLNEKSGRNYRLPYEAEWEYAARSGGKREKYSGGDSPDNVGWYNGNSWRKTHVVGLKPPNGLGLYDMTGNVWEWCEDWYDEDYYRDLFSSKNPRGPRSGSYRVLRGGAWNNSEWDVLRTSYRNKAHQDERDHSFGFRLCLPAD